MNKKQQYARIKKYFQSQFWNQTHEVLEKYDGEPRPLNQPISLDELKRGLQKMKCNKATGEDGISSELMKNISNEADV